MMTYRRNIEATIVFSNTVAIYQLCQVNKLISTLVLPSVFP